MTTTLKFNGLQQQATVGVNANKKQDQARAVGEGLQQSIRIGGAPSSLSSSITESEPSSTGIAQTETERSLSEVNVQADGATELQAITASLEELAERVVDGFSGVSNSVTNQEFLSLRDEYQRVRQAIRSSSGESLVDTTDGSVSISIGGRNGQVTQLNLATGFPSADLQTNFDGLDFTESQTILNGANSGRVESGDFNNDGFDDLVISAFNEVQIILSNGDGTFANQQTFIASNTFGPDTSEAAERFALADFDSDGNLDIAVLIDSVGSVGEDLSSFRVYEGDGTGGFSAGDGLADYSDNPQDIAAGDVDGDGDIDVIFNYGDFVQVATNDGSADFGVGPFQSFSPSGFTLETFDFNGDGADEILQAGRFIRSGDLSTTTDLDARGTVFDVNGDGILDIVGPTSGSVDDVFLSRLGNGDGTFAEGVTLFDIEGETIVRSGIDFAADLDGDGDDDFITDDDEVFLNDGTGAFRFSEGVTADVSFSKGVIGDFNNDGVIDFGKRGESNPSSFKIFLGTARPDTLRIDNSTTASFAKTTLEDFEVALEGVDSSIGVAQDSLNSTLNSISTQGVIEDPDINQTIRTEREAENGVQVLLDAIFRDSTLAIDSIGSLNPATVQNLLGTDREEDDEDGPLLF